MDFDAVVADWASFGSSFAAADWTASTLASDWPSSDSCSAGSSDCSLGCSYLPSSIVYLKFQVKKI